MIEIGMDRHKRFTVAAALDAATGDGVERRLEHEDNDILVHGPDRPRWAWALLSTGVGKLLGFLSLRYRMYSP